MVPKAGVQPQQGWGKQHTLSPPAKETCFCGGGRDGAGPRAEGGAAVAALDAREAPSAGAHENKRPRRTVHFCLPSNTNHTNWVPVCALGDRRVATRKRPKPTAYTR